MIDLNLIRVFVAIYETGSLSAAGLRLHVSQPSVSYNLARLRDLLGEQLFTRTREGMEATFFSKQIYPKFRQAISDIEGTIETTRNFNPALSARRFRVAMSDVGEMFFLPHIMRYLQTQAPGVEIDILEVDINKLEEWLNTGMVDAAVCNRGHLSIDSAANILFVDKYVCLVSQTHPRLGETLSMADYLAERHILVAPETGHNLVEERLRELECGRKIALRLPHFSVLPEVVATTDLLLTIPSGLAALFVSQHAVRALELPFAVRTLDVMLRWPRHSERIPAQRWLVSMLMDCLGHLLNKTDHETSLGRG